ncbi:LytR C-terminal domain-containing protein [Nocardioides cavernaquae]|uniref:LytR family transcriptional regulator n=1 Tax=Nocardioides cavernaquae TaxID=2321396 RepID=A0A3A5HA95_9ACTN|nr:LytR C-terminal domain-containing protein [Nocardioides cavernaquae]RJS46315.1 LytR family transcriptional regulator [Nocardioides cavernaquae]
MRFQTLRTRSAQLGEAGVTAPSPVVMLSVVAVAMAGIALIATRGEGGPGKLQPVSQPESSVVSTAPPTTAAPKPKPPVVRKDVVVEVYNTSAIKGLAARAASKASVLNWQVVGTDNWSASVPAPTIYFGPRLEDAARLLAKDLGITRVRPAVDPMKPDRLTVILTSDYS